MKLCALLVFLASLVACFGQSSIVITNLAEQRELAREFVQGLLSQRPATNSSATGVIKMRDAKGVTTNRPVEFQIKTSPTNWVSLYDATRRKKDSPPFYCILAITHTDSETNRYVLFLDCGLGTALSGNETMTPFAQSDFWIIDLGLEFLHWPEQRMTKKEMRRGQFCKVIESINPQPATNAYSKVISWIDHDSGGIVHAEAYDSKGKLLKEFDPKEFKKVKGEWQLREMEIRNVQTDSRTRIEFALDGK